VIERLFSGNASQILERALGASGLAHDVIAHNLANIDTPGYKRSEVIFQDRLRAAIKAAREGGLTGFRTDDRHISIGDLPSPGSVEPSVIVRAETSLRADGNNVDIDSEMVKLSQNTLLYQALAQLVRHKLNQLRSVITEGRR